MPVYINVITCLSTHKCLHGNYRDLLHRMEARIVKIVLEEHEEANRIDINCIWDESIIIHHSRINACCRGQRSRATDDVL